MIGIANRCIADAVAERGRRVDASADEVEGVQPDFSSDVVARSEIREAVARLGARDRELIALRYGADLSAREIGTVLDLRTNTVEVGLHRALARLRASLEGSGPESKGEPARGRGLIPDG
jgi:RNA polymerase sigma-70 factor (ECF subfamily)